MDESILQLTLIAIAIALSPFAIIETILVLLSKRYKINSVAYLLTIFISLVIVLLIGSKCELELLSNLNEIELITYDFIFILLGVISSIAAFKYYKNKNKVTAVPELFLKIENMGPKAVSLFSFTVTLVNPKNLMLLFGAGLIASNGINSDIRLLFRVIIFSFIALLPCLLIIGFVLIGGEKAQIKITYLKNWLLKNNMIIMALIFGLISILFFINGLSRLVQ